MTRRAYENLCACEAERWRLAGWLGGVPPPRACDDCAVCETPLDARAIMSSRRARGGGETPPGQPAGRQRSTALRRFTTL